MTAADRMFIARTLRDARPTSRWSDEYRRAWADVVSTFADALDDHERAHGRTFDRFGFLGDAGMSR